MKDVNFVGSSLEDLRVLPKAARQDMGRQLHRVQQGLDPLDWKPMPSVGHGVREIRIRDEGNNHRCVYVTNIGEGVYVLHVFTKKSRKTSRKDMDAAQSRLKALRARLAPGR